MPVKKTLSDVVCRDVRIDLVLVIDLRMVREMPNVSYSFWGEAVDVVVGAL